MTACALALADMATYDNTYSRVVAWLKILLPLLALAILSTLFLVARTIDPAQNIPYADVDIDELDARTADRQAELFRPDARRRGCDLVGGQGPAGPE